MKIAFRADASVQIGAGHVMRCLTLAKEMRGRGHDCVFICRDLLGYLGHSVTDAGFVLTLLPASDPDFCPKPNDHAHAAWAGAPWETDAEQKRTVALFCEVNAKRWCLLAEAFPLLGTIIPYISPRNL